MARARPEQVPWKRTVLGPRVLLSTYGAALSLQLQVFTRLCALDLLTIKINTLLLDATPSFRNRRNSFLCRVPVPLHLPHRRKVLPALAITCMGKQLAVPMIARLSTVKTSINNTQTTSPEHLYEGAPR